MPAPQNGELVPGKFFLSLLRSADRLALRRIALKSSPFTKFYRGSRNLKKLSQALAKYNSRRASHKPPRIQEFRIGKFFFFEFLEFFVKK